jgi:preprotein translocase subunit SecD
MQNQYPAWKYFLIALIVVVGFIYALPNLYPDDFAVQISGDKSTTVVDADIMKKAEEQLANANLVPKAVELTDKYGLVRLSSAEDQLKAQALLSRGLGSNYIAALNMVPTTPEWLRSINASPMKLGLDLRGGVQFLLEVDMEKALDARIASNIGELKRLMREEKIRYRTLEKEGQDSIRIRLRDAEERKKASDLAFKNFRQYTRTDLDEGEETYLILKLSEEEIKGIEDYAVQQNLVTLRNRVNELGVAEPLVQRQGRNRIVVELPGVQDTAAAKRIIGKTANLEFRLEAKPDAGSNEVQKFSFKNEPGREALLEKDIIVRGDNVSNANSGFDENGMPQVNISLDNTGGKLMLDVTKVSIGRKMGVVFIEQKSEQVERVVDGQPVVERRNRETRELINLATIQGAFGNQFRITGLDSPAEASELALLLRAGALAAPIYFVEERTIGPSLGQQNIDAGVTSALIGFVVVLIYMAFFYKVFGLIANVALALNVVLLLALLSMISATLTLPGIAGIVLTMGMAVDANVLINCRIRDELARGLSPQQAIFAGYERAFISIFDSNITTLIATVILFAVGTGPVKGFAITLSLGIITSMFTAVMVTRAIVNLVYGGRKVTKLYI